MNIRQQFEREFPGCSSRNLIIETQQEIHQLRLELHDLKRKHSQLSTKGIYITSKDADGYRRCRIKEVTNEKIVLHPLAEGQVSFVLNKPEIDRKGFVWIFDLGDRFWTGRCLRERLREKMTPCRTQIENKSRIVAEMEIGWNMFGMALTQTDLLHAEFFGLNAALLVQDQIRQPCTIPWKKSGF